MFAVAITVEAESRMTSVERVQYYSYDIPQEREEGTIVPAAGWPGEGAIEFQNVSLRYRADLPFVLKHVNFSIRPREKVGVVGRTGAGKSSLIIALFRMVELDAPNEGRILYDGLEIAQVPLTVLRRNIAIIPQDPVLFSGTLRFNLDLSTTCDDTAIWRVLELTELKDVVLRLKDGLDSVVTEGGSNFSVGQRQLICLGRAMLSPAKVVVMDEATASVDVETDAKIQHTIRAHFADRTVVVIAHRINTVIGSDRVMVMQDGAVAELDSPSVLLQNPDSLFNSLVRTLREVSAGGLAPTPSPPLPPPASGGFGAPA